MHILIRIQGHIGSSWQDWLEGLQIVHESDGTSVLMGQLPDQPALYGILNKLNHLSLSLLSLQSSDPIENDPSVRKGTSKMAQHNDIRTPESASKDTPTGVATGRVAGAAGAGPEHQRLQVFIGKWINEGQTLFKQAQKSL